MFKSNRLGLIVNLIFTIGIVFIMHFTIFLSKFLSLIVIFSLPVGYYFVYFAVQLILSILTMKILPEKYEEKVDLRSSNRTRKDVTDSLKDF